MGCTSDRPLLFESKLSIFNGRLCALTIASTSPNAKKIRVTSPSDVSILLEATLEEDSFRSLGQALREVSAARLEDPSLLGPRVETCSEKGPRLIVDPSISIPLVEPSASEKFDYVLGLYAKERSQLKVQTEKCTELTKQLQDTMVEYNSLKQRCEFQEKEISLLRELTETSRKRSRNDSIETPTKKRRCRCEDDGESCGSDCDGEMDEEEDDEGIQMFRAAAAKLQMSGENVEVSSEGAARSDKAIPNLMKQLEKISSVIVKAPNHPSTSSMATMQIKMEEGQERSGPLLLQNSSPSDDQNLKQKVVGVVQYVICQLCPEEEQKSMDFSNQKEMEEHFLDKHVDKEKKKCEACPSDQFQPHNIGQHYRLHTNSVYACEHCGKRGRRNYLMSHIRTHTGERPFQCDTCSKRFSDSSTLRRHRLVHTGEKKYQCPVCGRAIARKDNVKVHIRSHGIHI